MRDFSASLIDPSGHKELYIVTARNRTEARKEIARIYRQDTPPPRYGFYAFGRCRIVWIDTDE